ncbi:MAG: DNA polymerase III subunit gamma/tau [Candidatus Omnitrophica bacterium]|nr:DNA polymerase III subunit gamma/tau [Candidatus Omnitrophota bacterium]
MENTSGSYIVFARKWRPQDFDDVLGQEHIITTLKNAILSKRVAHAYIFTGPRGIGKTSVARIFAKGLNCEKGPTTNPCNKCASCKGISSSSSMDVMEIDGASNNSVDQIRELRENIKFAPSYGRYKVYIIDEVHMLSIGAFNALLKTLEEPPPHAKFIFATTNPEKVPATVMSRCQRFDFRRIPVKLIVAKIKTIAKSERLKISDEAIFDIARTSGGSMRDAESILDQLTSFCDDMIRHEDVVELLGIIEQDRFADITQRLAEKKTGELLKIIDELITEGKDLFQFVTGLIAYLRNLLVLKVSNELQYLVDLPDSYIEKLIRQSSLFNMEEILYIFYTLLSCANAIKRSEIARFITEASFIKLSMRSHLLSLPEMIERISQLESDISKDKPYSAAESTDTKSSLRTSNHGYRDREKNAFSGYADGDRLTKEPKRESGMASLPPAGLEDTTSSGVTSIALKEKNPSSDIPLIKEKVKYAWPSILEEVKKQKISIASYLLEGILVEVRNGSIILGFEKRFNFHKEVLELPNNKRFIEGIASKVLDTNVKMEFKIVEDSTEAEDENVGSAEEKASYARKDAESRNALDDPIIQSAIDIFNGKIVKGGGGADLR